MPKYTEGVYNLKEMKNLLETFEGLKKQISDAGWWVYHGSEWPWGHSLVLSRTWAGTNPYECRKAFASITLSHISGENRVQISNLFVDESMRRKRVATRIINMAHRVVEAAGYKYTILWVKKDNSEAKSLYKSMGYHEYGEYEKEDAVWMVRDI